VDCKIVFFDVDGTITNFKDGTISASTKDAIQALMSRNIKVVAATGRPLSMCQDLKELGIKTFITANGGYVKHKQTIIHKTPLDKYIVKEVIDFASKENHGLSFYTEDFSMNGVKNKQILNALRETLSLCDFPAVNEEIYNQEVFLMCLFADNAMVKRYIQAFPYLTFKRWHPFVLNVLQQEVSKSLAIIEVLKYFNIEQSKAIAFGDGDNDIDMLEVVGLGIAMGNGNDRLKQAADFVTKSSSEEGIAFALKTYGII